MTRRSEAARGVWLAALLCAACGRGKSDAGGPGAPQICGGATLPSDSISAAAAAGRIDGEWAALGRHDSGLDTVFGAESAEIWAAVDEATAQIVRAAAEADGIPLPTSAESLPDPAGCGWTSALTSSGQSWQSAAFLAAGELAVAVREAGTVSDSDLPPIDVVVPVADTKVSVVTHEEAHLKIDKAGSKDVVTVTTKKSTEVVRPGQGLVSATETTTVTVSIDHCPDANGVSPGVVSITGDGMTTSGKSYHVDSVGSYNLNVNDGATIKDVTLAGTMKYVTHGDKENDFNGTLTGTISNPNDVAKSTKGDVTYTANTAPDAEIKKMTALMFSQPMMGAATVQDEARKRWQNGSCVSVVMTPGSMMVDKGVKVAITGTAHHKVEDVDLNDPIVATLSGPGSLSPRGSPVKGPQASFSYTAGMNKGDAGTVTLTSTSNRGIGKASATYTVACDASMSCFGWAGEVSWTMSGMLDQTLPNGRSSEEASGSGKIVLSSGGVGIFIYDSGMSSYYYRYVEDTSNTGGNPCVETSVTHTEERVEGMWSDVSMLRATIVELGSQALVFVMIPGGNAAGHRTYHETTTVMGPASCFQPGPIDTDDATQRPLPDGAFMFYATLSTSSPNVLSGSTTFNNDTADPPVAYNITYSFHR